MSKHKKIFLNTKDDLGAVLRKVNNTKSSKIILNVPEGSALKSSADNFHALKREALLTDKDLIIESTDQDIEELSNIAKLESVNPIFGKNENFISDIIPQGNEDKDLGKHEFFNSSDDEGGDKDPSLSEFFSSRPEKPLKTKRKKILKKLSLPSIPSLPSPKKRWLLATTLVVAVFAVFTAVKVLPRATVTVFLKETPISFEEPVTLSSDVHESAMSGEGVLFPGEVITASKNMEIKFSATGEDLVERKAKGEMYIYNEHSSSPQPLLVKTRFETPDGKIYKLDEAVTVPGAKVVDGKIIPSRVKVSVTADRAGTEHNITSSSEEKWTIPGFKESGLMARYNGFYAKPIGSMTGGFSGITQTPTEKDIENAKEKLREELTNALKNQLLVVESPELTVLDSATEFEMVKEDIREEVDKNGKFSVFGQGVVRMFAFEEDELKETLIKKNNPTVDFEFEITKSELNYDNISIDWEEGEMTILAKGNLAIKPVVEETALKAQLAGKSESVIRPVIFSLPNLEKANISLWPFWVKEVPENPEKVKITFD